MVVMEDGGPKITDRNELKPLKRPSWSVPWSVPVSWRSKFRTLAHTKSVVTVSLERSKIELLPPPLYVRVLGSD